MKFRWFVVYLGTFFSSVRRSNVFPTSQSGHLRCLVSKNHVAQLTGCRIRRRIPFALKRSEKNTI
ncbi:unnamed protein product [Amoebophrya sp. A25]|nr:unnamed protein product [Amoebophrya sp. A25]|eukprot:GSA25T00016934001.1